MKWFKFSYLPLVVALGQATTSYAAKIPASPADSWPMYRGSASLTGLSKSKLSTSLKQLWTFKAKEGFHGTAAIAKGMVFVGCDDGNLYALDFKTGKKIWAFKTDDIVESAPLVKDS